MLYYCGSYCCVFLITLGVRKGLEKIFSHKSKHTKVTHGAHEIFLVVIEVATLIHADLAPFLIRSLTTASSPLPEAHESGVISVSFPLHILMAILRVLPLSLLFLQ